MSVKEQLLKLLKVYWQVLQVMLIILGILVFAAISAVPMVLCALVSKWYLFLYILLPLWVKLFADIMTRIQGD